MCSINTTAVHLKSKLNGVFKDAPKTFEKTFDLLLEEISTIFQGKTKNLLREWVTSVVKYNVPHGKQIRGKLVEMAYRVLSGATDPKQIEDAQILGWCVEILQASCLIADDIMDNGITRRGKPCWHKVSNVGMTAVNDAFLLENLVYQIIRQRFRSSKMYVHFVDLFSGVTFKTILGQSLDTRFPMLCAENENYKQQSAKELYESISTLKTSYYTIYLPIALAMVLAGLGSPADTYHTKLWNKFEAVSLKIGTLFQIQDDYFDCFGDEKKTGKMGSDIQEGKCSWLYVKAVELCASDIQRQKTLEENYGRLEPDNISRVKELYAELGLANEFHKIRQEMDAEIMNLIYSLDHPFLEQVLKEILQKISNRVC